MELDRREFTLGGGLLAAGITAQGTAAAARMAPRTPDGRFPATAWHQTLKRIMQVNFNQQDPQGFDADAYADYLASCKAQATFLSVTNIVAFYPSKIAGFPHSPFLGDRDIFGECVTALKKRGIRILGRLSIDLALTSLADQHPEWFRRDEAGNFGTRLASAGAGDPSFPGDYAPTCQFTSYYDQFVPQLIQEVMTRYQIDGIYSNGWPGVDAPLCYCQTCRKIGDPHSEAYKTAYLKRAVELWNLYSRGATKGNPDRIFSGNLGGGFEGGDLDLKELTADAAWFLADNQGRAGMGAAAWDASQQTRIAKAIVGDRPVPNSTGAYEISGVTRWRNVTGNPHEVRSRLFQTTAAGGVLYYHWLGFHQGFVEDRRWQEVGREVLAWQADHDAHFHNKRSIASVALVVAQTSNRLYKAPPGTGALDSVQGMYLLLNEARMPFDVVLDSDLSLDRLTRYSTLILPNMALMSDAQAKQIEAYVAQGGSLLATFETGLFDSAGKARSDFALAALFDIKKAGPREGFGRAGTATSPPNPGPAATQRIEDAAHPLTQSFRDTNWIQGSSWRVPITTTGKPLLSHIPQYPIYPTEAVYSRAPHTSEPTVVVRERQRSRLVYLAGDIDAGYWRTGAADLGDLVINAIRWLAATDQPLRVEGDGLIEIYGWETQPGYAIHLLNFTAPTFRGGAQRGTFPVGPQRVRLNLSDDRTIRRARLLRSGQAIDVRQAGRQIDFTVPNLADYEVAALEV
jgi:hypothetical protein